MRVSTKVTILLPLLILAVFLFALDSNRCLAQTSDRGQIAITVSDRSGAIVAGAEVRIADPTTGRVTDYQTDREGISRIDNLNFGKYKLTISKAGFSSQKYESVVIQAGRITDLVVQLKAGRRDETVDVRGDQAPLLERTSTTLQTTIDMKQLNDLPIFGRDLTQLAFLTPGYASAGAREDSTVNGMPGAALGNTIDGINNVNQKNKTAGTSYDSFPIEARLEQIAEVTINSGELDASQGGGQSGSRIQFASSRGTGRLHGSLFELHRNRSLNANSYIDKLYGHPRPAFVLNDFGGNFGGPIWKDKAFFFFALAKSIEPRNNLLHATIPTPDAENGIYKFRYPDGTVAQLNVFDLLSKHPNYARNGTIATAFANIDAARSYGSVSGNPTVNTQTLTWTAHGTSNTLYPSARLDYQITPHLDVHVNGTYGKSDSKNVYPAPLPGPAYSDLASGNLGHNWILSAGADWTLNSTTVNNFTVGRLYTHSVFSPELATDYSKVSEVFCRDFEKVECGLDRNLPQGSHAYDWNILDNVIKQHGRHNMNFGLSYLSDEQFYDNIPGGIPTIDLGMDGQDPVAKDLLTQINNYTYVPANERDANGNPYYPANVDVSAGVVNLYSMITGQVSSVYDNRTVDPKTKQYASYIGLPIHYGVTNWGIYAQDSWKLTPHLTLNYGLRWDFDGAIQDRTGLFTSPTYADFWGPSGINRLFQPGIEPGVQDPQYEQRSKAYNASYVHPQPHLGIAWAPAWQEGFLGKLTGQNRTVVRVAYSLKSFTEGDATFEANATGPTGSQLQTAQVSQITSGQGFFKPGTQFVGQPIPQSLLKNSQETPSFSVPMSAYTWNGGGNLSTVNPNIKQPYVQNWSFGIQRQLGRSTVLETRYVGTRSVHTWFSYNMNQENIRTNGFSKDFATAKANLDACRANAAACIAAESARGITLSSNSAPVDSFANLGLPGQHDMPIFDAAFGTTGSLTSLANQSGDGYQNGSFVQDLVSGSAGSLASALETPAYFCRMVGDKFSPCISQAPSGADGPEPANILQANPFAMGHPLVQLTSEGFSTYNSAQVELRQQSRWGAQFSANYTFAKTLGITPSKANGGAYGYDDLANHSRSYLPTGFDIRHSFNLYGTYDLPFGRGKQFLKTSRQLDRLVGGWTLGNVTQLSSGAPFQLQGGSFTVTTNTDSGVNLVNIDVKQLQKNVGVYKIPGAQSVYFINPKLLQIDASDPNNTTGASPGGLKTQYYTVPSTPGVFGQNITLYGPHIFGTDFALTKHIPITDRVRFTLQGEFLNAFNHTRWIALDRFANSVKVTDSNFGITTQTVGDGSQYGTDGDPRNIQFRANLDF